MATTPLKGSAGTRSPFLTPLSAVGISIRRRTFFIKTLAKIIHRHTFPYIDSHTHTHTCPRRQRVLLQKESISSLTSFLSFPLYCFAYSYSSVCWPPSAWQAVGASIMTATRRTQVSSLFSASPGQPSLGAMEAFFPGDSFVFQATTTRSKRKTQPSHSGQPTPECTHKQGAPVEKARSR